MDRILPKCRSLYLRLDKLPWIYHFNRTRLSVECLFLRTAGRHRNMTFGLWMTLQKSKATDREVAGQVEV